MNRKGISIRKFRLLIGIMCLSTFCVLIGANSSYSPIARNERDSLIHLIYADVMYKKPEDVRATILIKEKKSTKQVQFLHNGTILYCDSARFYKEDNSFDAFGHVKMLQGDTLTLVSDTLYYDGFEERAKARGNCTMTHRKTKLVTSNLDYDRVYDVGMYVNGGTLYDNNNVLTSDWGQYTPGKREAFFTDNVVLKGYEEKDKKHEKDPKFTLISDTLYYYTDTQIAKIVTPTNITSNDGTFVYGQAGDYDTKFGEGFLLNRSYVIKDMRKIVGDSLYSNKETGISEAYGNVILTDDENLCMLTGGFCSYNQNTGEAVATDRAVAYEYSQKDTLYVHGDTLKMFSFNMNTDSAYHDMHAYHKVRANQVACRGVGASMVVHELDSCTYFYGQPILWNEQQQIFGEEIRIYNNDSTIDWAHIIDQAMTIEKIDSMSYNQVSSKEMFAYFKDGVMERNEAKGNVYVDYFMNEDDGSPIGMNYTESTELKVYMENKKVEHIWMPAATGTVYPVFAIPSDKRYLKGFAWFDYIRPKDKDDIYDWRQKEEKDVLKKTEKKTVPLQRLGNMDSANKPSDQQGEPAKQSELAKQSEPAKQTEDEAKLEDEAKSEEAEQPNTEEKE